MTMQQDSTHPTGVAADETSEGSGKVLRARERKANAALQLRLAGATWDEVAEVIGYPTAREALVATERALERELRTEESQKMMRGLAGKRLERLLRSVWTKAIDEKNPEHLNAVTKARELIAQHTKLFGLDAPTEVTLHTPAAQELEQWVAEVTKVNRPELEEADIFDAEILDDTAEGA